MSAADDVGPSANGGFGISVSRLAGCIVASLLVRDRHARVSELNRSRLACLSGGVVRTVRKLPLLPHLVDAEDDVLIADMDQQPQTRQ